MIAYEWDSKFRAYVDASFEAAGITPDVIMEFDSHEAVKAMVMAGFGVAMDAVVGRGQGAREGRLVELAIAGFEELARITSLIIAGTDQSPPSGRLAPGARDVPAGTRLDPTGVRCEPDAAALSSMPSASPWMPSASRARKTTHTTGLSPAASRHQRK